MTLREIATEIVAFIVFVATLAWTMFVMLLAGE